MCRLFGLRTDPHPVSVRFWMIDARDSLERQSHRNADGFGLGTFDPDGTPVVRRAPHPAWSDPDFAAAAEELRGRSFVAHVRRASAGADTEPNTHPFEQDGRLFAHNGGVGDLPAFDAHLAALGASGLVRGETDSERYFALVTTEIRAHGGDVGAGVVAAVDWIRAHLPFVSLNAVLATPDGLWALRYPSLDTLFVLERQPGRAAVRVAGSHLAVASDQLGTQPFTVVASERLDDDPGWRPLASGELLHVGADGRVSSRTV
jgi:predicted glutamine amidotransferase